MSCLCKHEEVKHADNAVDNYLPFPRGTLCADTDEKGDVMHALIIDDDEPSCQLLEKVLQQSGLTADWTTNSRTGLAWSIARPYDLFLLDVHMPDLLGTDIAAAIKAHDPAAKVILISAFPDATSQRLANALEVPLLCKPFSPNALLALLSQMLLPGW